MVDKRKIKIKYALCLLLKLKISNAKTMLVFHLKIICSIKMALTQTDAIRTVVLIQYDGSQYNTAQVLGVNW